jgi:hypothetical protein
MIQGNHCLEHPVPEGVPQLLKSERLLLHPLKKTSTGTDEQTGGRQPDAEPQKLYIRVMKRFQRNVFQNGIGFLYP